MANSSEEVRISIPDGQVLSGEFCQAAVGGSPFTIVWLHGFGSHRGGEKAAEIQERCRRRGWAFAAFDFRGHGASSGSIHDLRASRLIEDIAAIRGFLASRGHATLGLVGSSMGGFAAAWFAKQNPDAVLGCVLIAPAFDFLRRRWDRMTEAERELSRQTGRIRVKSQWVDVEVGSGLIEERDRFLPDDLAAGWRTPALIFHGLADDVVPVEDSLAFIRAVEYPRVELRLLRDGDHRLTDYKSEIAAETGRYFETLLSPLTPP
jgi:alpha-beta hydrolase superfamily lysophospholipase